MSLSVVGVALVARPPVIFGKSEDITAVNQFIGVGLGIGAAISDGLGFALTRFVCIFLAFHHIEEKSPQKYGL